MILPRVYEATSTRAEFVRLLCLATDAATFDEVDGVFFGQGWSLRLTPLAPLEIGQVRLERQRVEIEFDGPSAAEQDAFMRRLTLYFQRGGG